MATHLLAGVVAATRAQLHLGLPPARKHNGSQLCLALVLHRLKMTLIALPEGA